MRVSNNLSFRGLLLLLLLTGFCKYTHTHGKCSPHNKTKPGRQRHTHTHKRERSQIAMEQIKFHAASQYLFIYAFFFVLELVSTAAGRLLRLRTQWDTAIYPLPFNCYR